MAGRYVCILALAAALDCPSSQDCFSYCRKTYQGERNYYNATDGDCYSVPLCNTHEVLDTNENRCMLPQDLVPTLSSNYSQDTQNVTVIPDKPITCLHGTLANDNSTCTCESGYTTSPKQNQTAAAVLMCDIQGSDTQVPEGYTLDDDGSLYLTDQVTGTQGLFGQIPWVYVVIGAAVFCVSLCVGMKCCLAWMKHRKRHAKMPHVQSYLPRFKPDA